VTDALLLARHADMTVLVVQHDKVDKKVIKRSLGALRKVTDNVLGAVLNAVDVKTRGHYYYYYQHHREADRPKGKGGGRKEPRHAEAHDATFVS
jgi:Mrp family chromosome partitioning ATPase